MLVGDILLEKKGSDLVLLAQEKEVSSFILILFNIIKSHPQT